MGVMFMVRVLMGRHAAGAPESVESNKSWRTNQHNVWFLSLQQSRDAQ
jgi:hypothetical protein